MSDTANPLAKFDPAEVAEAVGATDRSVRRWRSGSNVPAGAHLGRLLSFLNRPENLKKLGRRKPVTFEELFGADLARTA
jgi:hypothetical protein